MKSILQWGTAIAVIALLMGCGSKSSNNSPVNHAPNAPSVVQPADGAANQGLTDTLKWKGGDPDAGDTVTYTVYFGTDNPPATAVSNGIRDSSYIPPMLAIGGTYYWKIVATDGTETVSGPVWSFTTSTNHPPLKPTLLAPADSAKKQLHEVQLSWSGNDSDILDTLRYDVYLGTANPPTSKVSPLQSGTTYSATGLTAGSTYYWYIVANDGQAAMASDIHLFTTNYAPTIPAVSTPVDGATNQDLKLTLSWTSTDADGDVITYTLTGDTVNPPSRLEDTTLTAANLAVSKLQFATKYYWRVTATDGIDTTLGPVWSFTTKTAPGMHFIQGGTFSMGSTANANEGPVHNVTLSSFWIDTTDVTQADYQLLMGANPSQDQGVDRPVETVTWYDAVLYCNARSRRDGLDTIYKFTSISAGSGNSAIDLLGLNIDTTAIRNGNGGYHLPTEAQWEYACRAGSLTDYYWGATIDSAYCWYLDNSDFTTHPVATKKPNAWGLYDMSGNVLQWCNDSYGLYSASAQTNPMGPPIIHTGAQVVRAGAFFSSADLVRSSYRVSGQAANPNDDFIGFRCAR